MWDILCHCWAYPGRWLGLSARLSCSFEASLYLQTADGDNNCGSIDWLLESHSVMGSPDSGIGVLGCCSRTPTAKASHENVQ